MLDEATLLPELELSPIAAPLLASETDRPLITSLVTLTVNVSVTVLVPSVAVKVMEYDEVVSKSKEPLVVMVPSLETLNLSLPVPDKEYETVPSDSLTVVVVTEEPELAPSLIEIELLANCMDKSKSVMLTENVSDTVLVPSVAVKVME